MRRSIFIETKYLEERQIEKCSSLDGPSCLMFMESAHGKTQYQPSSAIDGPGVLPERLLHDLGVVDGDLNFTTPDLLSFQYALSETRKSLALKASPKLLAGSSDIAKFRGAHKEPEHGILHFAGLGLDSRVPLTFSQGMPHPVVATWDGKWMARSCHSNSERLQLNMDNSASSSHVPALASTTVDNVGGEGNHIVSTVAQLAGSLGYLRFSQPIIIRSLYARWQPNVKAVPAVIGGRLGLKDVWTSHMNPEQIRQSPGWQSFGAEVLQPVDEIVFLAASGLEIGAIDFMAFGSNGLDLTERSAIVLAPSNLETTWDQADVDDGRPKFQMKVEPVTPLVAPFIMPLQEAIDRNLLFRLPKSSKHERKDHAEATNLEVMKKNIVWKLVSETNQEMFDHSYITKLWTTIPAASLPARGADRSMQAKVDTFARTFTQSSSNLPSDVRKDLSREREGILKALVGFLEAGGSWSAITKRIHAFQDSVEEPAKHMTAKRWQASLDLLTAAFLHSQAPELQKQAQDTAQATIASLSNQLMQAQSSSTMRQS
jgi:hypothetical protein